MMIRGETNPRGDRAAGETKNYLAWEAKLVPRFVTPPPQRPRYDAAGATASATSSAVTSPAPAPAPAPAGAAETEQPTDAAGPSDKEPPPST
jgi:hypothetical protein